jgi:PST family polysaccharide transporter
MLKKIYLKTKNNEMMYTSFYTGIGTAIGFISGFVINKVIAVYLGPSGLAIVSQFQNFIGVASVLASGGILQGVVKYLSEVRDDEEKQSILLSTSLKISLIFSVIVGIVTSVFARGLSLNIFNSLEYHYVFILLGFTVVLFGLNSLLISILNGTGEIKKLVAVKVSTNLFGLLITSSCVYLYGIKGALTALAISQSVIFFVSLLFVTRSRWFKRKVFSKKLDKIYSLKLFQYSLMAISSMILTPVVQIGIRNIIVEKISIIEAGYWDGLSKISLAYLGIISSTLSIYYLPKLSVLKERLEIRRELLNGYKIITPLLILLVVTVYLARNYIITFLYSNDFTSMKILFAPQLAGDFFKILSWILSYLMLAKSLAKIFILTQTIFLTGSYFLSSFLLGIFGLYGIVLAHFFINLTYFIFIVIYFKNYLKK